MVLDHGGAALRLGSPGELPSHRGLRLWGAWGSTENEVCHDPIGPPSGSSPWADPCPQLSLTVRLFAALFKPGNDLTLRYGFHPFRRGDGPQREVNALPTFVAAGVASGAGKESVANQPNLLMGHRQEEGQSMRLGEKRQLRYTYRCRAM
jgi:hypothetical protein